MTAVPARAKVPLDYAPPRKRRDWRWRLFRWAICLLVVAGALLYCGRRWGPGWWKRAQFLRVERECMDYTAPPDLVMFTTDPDEGKRLAATAGYKNPRLALGVWYVPPLWKEYPHGGWEPGPAFLHRRSRPDGQERLVAIDMSGHLRGGALNFYVRLIVPATWRRDTEVKREGQPYLSMGLYGADRVRVFAGQPDPDNPSHFTIGYTLNGVPGTIDGWLLDDDTVSLRPREGWYVPDEDLGSGTQWYPKGTSRPGRVSDLPVAPTGAGQGR